MSGARKSFLRTVPLRVVGEAAPTRGASVMPPYGIANI
jgi:hypothetical protein